MHENDNGNHSANGKHEAFTIRDEASANWLVRKIKEARAYAEHVKAWAEHELRRAHREEKFFLTRYGPQLQTWLEQRIKDSSSRRSIKLPAGTVALRSDPGQVVVESHAQLVAWCEEHLVDAVLMKMFVKGRNALQIEAWIRESQIEGEVTKGVLKAAVNNHFKVSGELPAGTSFLPPQDTLHIK